MNENLSKKSKVLIVGSKNEFSLDSIYFKTFKNLGYNVDFFNIEKSIENRIIANLKKYLSLINFKISRKKLVYFFEKKRKKYDLIIFFKSIYLDKNTLKKVKSLTRRSIFINIFPDDPFDIKNPIISNKIFLKTINEFDYFCIWSKKIKKKLTRKYNSNFIYLPFGYDSILISRYKLKKITRENEINFIGTYDSNRMSLLSSIEIKKKIFGGNWLRLKKQKLKKASIGGHIYKDKIFKLMNQSAISLNILRKQNYSSHNMRTFEIPANNGLMLTTRSREQKDFFKENVACYMYSSKKELNRKIKYILNHPDESEKIRKKGNLLVKKHSYQNRIKYLMKKIKKI